MCLSAQNRRRRSLSGKTAAALWCGGVDTAPLPPLTLLPPSLPPALPPAAGVWPEALLITPTLLWNPKSQGCERHWGLQHTHTHTYTPSSNHWTHCHCFTNIDFWFKAHYYRSVFKIHSCYQLTSDGPCQDLWSEANKDDTCLPT